MRSKEILSYWPCLSKADLDGYIELLACNVQSPSAPIRSSAHEQVEDHAPFMQS